MQAQLFPLFNDPAAAHAEADVDRVCNAWGITALIASDNDPVFADPAAWPWRRPCNRGERSAFVPSRAVRRTPPSAPDPQVRLRAHPNV